MELKEYHYVYYSYEEYGRGYIGSRTCKCIPEKDIKYFGTFNDKTFKPTQKIILKDDYATREEAYADEIILQRFYKVAENPHFANQAYQTSTKFYVSKEQSIQNGKKGGKIQGERNKKNGTGFFKLTKKEKSEVGKRGNETNRKNGTGLYGMTFEQKSESGRKGGKIGGKKSGTQNRELKRGVCGRSKEKMTADGKKGGTASIKKQRELGIGVFALPFELRSENGKKGNQTNKKNGTGIYSLTFEDRSNIAKNVNSQKWMCSETGYISNAGGLSRYQKSKGIDTTKRIRLS